MLLRGVHAAMLLRSGDQADYTRPAGADGTPELSVQADARVAVARVDIRATAPALSRLSRVALAVHEATRRISAHRNPAAAGSIRERHVRRPVKRLAFAVGDGVWGEKREQRANQQLKLSRGAPSDPIRTAHRRCSRRPSPHAPCFPVNLLRGRDRPR